MKSLLLILSLMLSFALSAQEHDHTHGPGHQPVQHSSGFSFEDYQQKKCDYIVSQLELTDEQKSTFIPAYKELLHDKSHLFHKYGDAHRIMRKVRRGEQVADTTMQRAASNVRQLQLEDAQLEQQYFQKFEKLLTPAQLIRLQEAEQKFKNDMMKQGPKSRKER